MEKKKTKTITLYDEKVIGKFNELLKEYKKRYYMENDKMATVDDITEMVFIPALEDILK